MESSAAAKDSESTCKLAALAEAAAELTASTAKDKDEPINKKEGDGSNGHDPSATKQQPNEVTPANTFESLDSQTKLRAASTSSINESRTSPAEAASTAPATTTQAAADSAAAAAPTIAATPPSSPLSNTPLTSDPSCPWKNRQDLLALWKKRYSELLDYRARHGDCNVPQRHPPNPELGRWVKDQRAFRRNGKLSRERIELLDSLGFLWSVKKPDDFWEDKFNSLKEYKKRNDGDVNPPRDGEWKLLACWVDRQRRAGRKGKLTRERVDLLNGVGFVWDPRGVDGGADEIVGCDEVKPSSTKESSLSLAATTSTVSMQPASNLSVHQAPVVAASTSMSSNSTASAAPHMPVQHCHPVMTKMTPHEHCMLQGSTMMPPTASAQAAAMHGQVHGYYPTMGSSSASGGMANYPMMHNDNRMPPMAPSSPYFPGQHPAMMGQGMPYRSDPSMPGSTMEAAGTSDYPTTISAPGVPVHPNMAAGTAMGQAPMHANMAGEPMSTMAALEMQHYPNRMPTAMHLGMASAMPGQAPGMSELMASQSHYQGMPGSAMPGSSMPMHRPMHPMPGHSNMSASGFAINPNSQNPYATGSNYPHSSRSAQLRAMIAEEERQTSRSRTQHLRAMLEQEEQRVNAMRAMIEEEERQASISRTHQLRAMLEEEEMRVGHMMNQGMMNEYHGYNYNNMHTGMQMPPSHQPHPMMRDHMNMSHPCHQDQAAMRGDRMDAPPTQQQQQQSNAMTRNQTESSLEDGQMMSQV